VTIAKVTRDRCIQGDAVPPLLVNYTAVRHRDGEHFDGDPHFRMLGQL
jgi:hypothetical protein